jgi:short-subunit dehydrogenase
MWPFSRSRSESITPPVVVLTGAANGIGRATALALAARGFRLGLIDRDEAALGDVARTIAEQGVPTHAVGADVRDRDSLARAVSAIEETIGPTDVLVPCAGVGGLSSATDLDLGQFGLMLEINVLGVARTIEAVLPGMYARGSGHIVGISSVAGHRGMPWMPGYSASKAALTTYLEALRPALKRRGVTITTVYPGFVKTAMTIDTPFRNPVPMLEPAQAAEYTVKAVMRRPRDYTFPFSAAFGMGVLRRLPNRLFDRVMDQAGPRALTTDF